MNQTDLTPEDITFLTDKTFFPARARISLKIRQILGQLHQAYTEELVNHTLLAPEQFSLESHQFVKGEHLEEFPYQYLDFPRYYTREEKFSFRTLFWWGHHIAFALILEGGAISQFKKNLIDRYSSIADQGICLCLTGSLWEWKQGPGYTLEITRDRRPEMAAILSNRPFFKLAKFVPFHHDTLSQNNVVPVGREVFTTMLSIITR